MWTKALEESTYERGINSFRKGIWVAVTGTYISKGSYVPNGKGHHSGLFHAS